MPRHSPFHPAADRAQLLDALVAASSDAVIGQDLDGTVRSWNSAAEQMFGYSAHEIVGQPGEILVPPDRAGERAGMLARIERGQTIERFETERVSKDGRHVAVSLTMLPIENAGGTLIGTAVVAHDITARRRAEHALRAKEARWRAIIDAAVDAIIVIDATGAISAFNPGAERLFGYAEHEVLGKNVNLLMPSPYREEHDGYIRRYLQTGEHKIIGIGREVTGLRRDGTSFPLHLSVGEMQVGAERQFIGILHDLTARVVLEERLREQTALARLGEMAAVIAHEVRNPLAAVRGALQVIGSRIPDTSADAPVIKEIIARVDALNALLKDLLLFARLPKPNMKTIELAPLVELTANLLKRDPAWRDITIVVSGGAPPLRGDGELLRIVFQNLLINAAQAMQRRGEVHVHIAADGDAETVRVLDGGPGIPIEVRQKLFQPFYTTKARGTGLGLATARRLVEAHDGTIVVECPPAGGTSVTVRLPVRA